MTISALAAGVAASGLALQTFSVGLAALRCRRDGSRMAAPAGAPPVSVVQPLCGVEAFSKETLASVFALDYPEYELLFCLADPADPIAPQVRRAIAANPKVPARLLIGDDRVSGNPKLNNVVKGWKAVRHAWVVIADSNVLAPPDYIQRLMARWRSDTGIVCAPPIGVRPETLAAKLECAFLNTYQARWQYAGETLGFGFAQGKTMLWRRDVLEAGGGVEALGAEINALDQAALEGHGLGLDAELLDRLGQGDRIAGRIGHGRGLAEGRFEIGRDDVAHGPQGQAVFDDLERCALLAQGLAQGRGLGHGHLRVVEKVEGRILPEDDVQIVDPGGFGGLLHRGAPIFPERRRRS